ncbi:MAG: hypothetical protein ACOY45_00865 [Pseudomonadota bacterium]
MSLAARQVLSDCRLAAMMLDEETDPDRWRVAGAVALLRAVGHVLLNVDQPASDCVAREGKEAHRRWKSPDPAHAIYREFIEEERNNILKEYRSKVHPLEEVQVAVRLTLQYPETGEITYLDQVVPLDENMFRPIVEGFGEGEDARDVFQDAISWWDRELAGIERNCGVGRPTEDSRIFS